MPFSVLGPLTILVPRAQVTEQADFDAGDFDVRFPLSPWIRKPQGAHWLLVCRVQAGLLADDDDEVEDIAPIVMEDFGEEEHDARLSSVVKVSNPLTPFPSFLPTEIDRSLARVLLTVDLGCGDSRLRSCAVSTWTSTCWRLRSYPTMRAWRTGCMSGR